MSLDWAGRSVNYTVVDTVVYCKGARVWVRDPDSVWQGGELKQDYKDGDRVVNIELEDGSEKTLQLKNKTDLPPLRNPDILIGENDLTSLSYLHEPAVLFNLHERFIQNNAIYTYCGIVLVAINPYQQLPLYGEDVIYAYRGQDMGSMDPHIFAVAEEAFKKMSRFDQNQSIIVSGESGAGKTVSAKYAMRYFATVGGSSAETQIEKKVLASNPVMEAIGNAKTTRNDNSSRFGKYIEISFNTQHHIIGANMRTYLLEKSRVVFQAEEERNYHIFYQLCASSHQPELAQLKLGHPDEFFYTNQGESPTVDSIDDKATFEETKDALTLLGFQEDHMTQIFRVIAAVLHFGNVDIRPGDHESSKIEKNNESLPVLCELLGIEEVQMKKWLCNRKIITVREILTKPLTATQAVFSRDALAKRIYSELFSWIVSQINKNIQATSKAKNFIGVLDIYGFEMFTINSFEQFCINYANEKLQQQFTQHVFKLEQEEYVREQIEWSFIDFYDNQPCIDLIENKLGILDLLDEECMLPKGSDENWCQKLYKSLSKSKHFSKPRMSQSAFIVHHFADKVEYQSDGCVEKNRDNVNEEHINILRGSQFEFVADLFREKKATQEVQRKAVVKPGIGPAVKGQKSFKSSVGSQFRESLQYLMQKLNSTIPHYVRCIKPNDTKAAFEFEPKRAVEQLRACGVLETIRISAAGYPSRWTYAEFFTRYRALMKPKEVNRKNVRGTCEKTLARLIPDPDKYQFGKTKIFFRAGQVAYMEKLRADKLRAACVLMQKTVRGWVQKKKYMRLRSATIIVQKMVRGFLARRLTRHMRRTNAATCIQKRWRGYHQRQKYLHVRHSIVTIQAFTRGMYGRRYYTKVLRQARATTIQRTVRGWLARKRYHKARKAVILLQCCTRRMYAKRELKKLKIEARSVEHLKKLQKGMENKIISLQQKVNDLTKEKKEREEQEAVIEKLRTQVKTMEQTQAESVSLSKRLADLERENAKLRQELDQTILEKNELHDEMGRVLQEHKEEKDKQEAESEKLRKDLQEKENQFKELEESSEERIKREVEAALEEVRKELAEEKERHQRLLQDYSRMEQRCDNLKEDLEAAQHPPQYAHHVRTDSSEGGESGYGTLSTNRVEDVESVEDEIQEQGQEKASMDMNVFLKLQQRVRDLEKEKRQFQLKLEKSQSDSRTRTSTIEGDLDASNAELVAYKDENMALKQDLENLRDAVKSSSPEDDILTVLTSQVAALGDENHKHRQEILRLKTELTNQQRRWENRYNGEDSPDGGVSKEKEHFIEEEITSLKDDGNIEVAYKSLKMTNHLFAALNASQTSLRDTVSKYGSLAENHNDLLVGKMLSVPSASETRKSEILEKEIQALKKNHEVEIKQLKEALESLKKDNDRQQEIIGQSLKMTPEARINQTVQHEISRLTNENLDLLEQNEYLEKQVRKLKKQLKVAYRRVTSTLESSATPTSLGETPAASHLSAPANISDTTHIGPANVRTKEREIQGMLDYRQEDDTKIIKTIIIDFQPKTAENLLPGLPAYVIFMCIRHADDINDDRKVKALLTGVINGIKKTVKKHFEDFEYVSFWLTNTIRLMHTLKQYSGEENFCNQNTRRQNDHCLRNFDLSEYRQVMNDLGVHIYQMLVHIIENKLLPMIVPAMLESDSAGLTTKPSGLRGRSASMSADYDGQKISIDSLIKQLTTFLTVMNNHGTDPEVVKQAIKQSFYLITASTINNILLRKDMCHWSKGVQIRYNMSELEEWLRSSKLFDHRMEETLEPLVQIAQLLQVKKRTDDDVTLICETCTKLTTTQVVKILNLYTPDEYEKKTEVSFIRKVQSKLVGRMDPKKDGQLLIDTKYTFPVTFPYNPSSVLLNEITIPDSFKLDCVKRV
ncbi:unconventional myosin-Va-like isoform X3 [Acanthaster planci]|uniref:Unconventional myosin-Va-like isoform X3 n=1 Tax=Acanthaster planci TaxID=133434 RepID=A0A8B7XNX3_ACAPL|nr:unconventional myosin-Va-like isoform X3 [Acanthaster planci]